MIGINSQIDLVNRRLALSMAELTEASKNIANVNTPGYKATTVVAFSDLMDGSTESISIQPKTGLASRKDGNNVDIDREVGQLRKSLLKQRVFTQLLSTQIRQMRSAMES